MIRFMPEPAAIESGVATSAANVLPYSTLAWRAIENPVVPPRKSLSTKKLEVLEVVPAFAAAVSTGML